MNLEEVEAIAKVIGSLGDKGLVAFIIWILKDITVDLFLGLASLWVIKRLAPGIVAAFAQPEE